MLFLPKEEQIPLELRGLYEKYGYRRFRMGKFESYDLYRENKNFLESDGIITFTDLSGKLMALKPDVTISIVKNSRGKTQPQKFYYVENVFRLDAANKEYREISQMGIEYIGGETGYAEAEVIALALKSLAAISGEYMLDIGSMGFVSSFITALGFDDEARYAVLKKLKHKNSHELYSYALECGLTEDKAALLRKLPTLSGGFEAVLSQAGELVLCDEMSAALDELKALCAVLKAHTDDSRMRLDFSALNDIDYYNGIVFKGYISGAPGAVLAGGRYDGLMQKFGSPLPALGFALYLGELERALAAVSEYDVDALLIYGDTDASEVFSQTRALLGEYSSVRAERTAPEGVRARYIKDISVGAENA
ncbi:MAG: hypothetical protein GX851_03755 [Clostridiales bacterium]|nr:hypothetical protein [Clostridiales bacterium]